MTTKDKERKVSEKSMVKPTKAPAKKAAAPAVKAPITISDDYRPYESEPLDARHFEPGQPAARRPRRPRHL
jgi:hypothetical protein